MATRNERVVLTLDDQFSSKMARAAAVTAVMNRELNDLDGTSVGARDGVEDLGDSVEKTRKTTERSTQTTKQYTLEMAVAAERETRLRKELRERARVMFDSTAAAHDAAEALSDLGDETQRFSNESAKSGPDIDKFSGRLRTLIDIGIVAGPVLVPLGASTIPLLAGSVAGLGAAAGGLGVTILAFKGLGDAIKALDAYRLEPTAANLEKLRIEQEKLGPAGAEFARSMANLEPTLRELQNTSREGIFPGVEDGIDALLGRGPQVERIISNIAEGLGNIARDAGEGLASDRFTPFFDYIESDAQPTLEAFAASAGNVALGVANMLVAFAPLSRDFTGGLEEATAAFANWSEGLDDNASFQSFLDYVQQSGPQAIDFFTSLVKAIAGLLQAAAPIASVLLPALTQLLDLFAAVAQSDAGPALYAAAAGLIAFNRASAATVRYGPRLAATFQGLSAASIGKSAAGIGLLALSMSDLDDKAGATNTTMGAFAGLVAGGPLGAAAGATIGTFLDLKKANDDFTASVEHAQDVLRNGDTSEMRSELEQLREEYAKTQELLNPDGFLDSLKSFALGSSLGGSAFLGVQANGAHNLSGAIDELTGGMKQGGTIADLFAHDIGLTGDQFRVAAGSAEAFSGALARLNGWFDKRDAVRGYKDAIDELRKSMKNGFTREDAANLDNIGRSILQVAQNIKNPGARANFLAEARAQLVDMAQNAGPKAAAAIREVIGQFDDKGLTHPKIEITADDRRARQTIDPLKQDLTILGRSTVEPEIGANDNPWRMTYGRVKRDASGLDDLVATPKVDADDGAFTRTANQVGSFMDQIDRRRANPTITADASQALSAINGVLARLGLVRSKSISITTYHNDKYGGQAGGGGHEATPKADGGRIRARLADGGRAGRILGRSSKPLFDGEGPRYYKAAYKHNRPFAVDGPAKWDWPYQTTLNDAVARAFETWVASNNIPFDPGARIVDYDMRGFWKAKRPKSWTEGQHFPDTWKTPYDTTFSHESKYATKDNPFVWHGDKLVDERNGQVIFGAADGAQVPKTGLPYADRHLYMLADGEFVVSNRFGQADRHLSLLEDINANRLADGGSAGKKERSRPSLTMFSSPEIANLLDGANSVGEALRTLNRALRRHEKALDKSENALDREAKKRDEIASSMASLSSSIAGKFGVDLGAQPSNPWASGGGGIQAQIDTATGQANALPGIIAALQAAGLTGPALEQALQEMDFGQLQALAANPSQAGQLGSSLTALYAAQSTAGGAASQAVYGAAYDAQLKAYADQLAETRGLRGDVKRLEAAVKAADHANQLAQKDNADRVGDHVNGAAGKGKRNQVYGNGKGR